MQRPNSLPSNFEQTLTEQGYDPQLVHGLVQVFNNVILDETCRNGGTHGTSFGQKLHDIMCQFATHYSFPPDYSTQQLTSYEPFADGNYGTVFTSTFNNKPILTKTTKTFNVDMIREVFINMVMINSFLLHDQLIDNLVPTIGMYVMQNDNVVPPEWHINMVQIQIDGTTLHDRLIKNGITVEQLKHVIGQLFSTLTILQESPYHIRHNDVHTKNVIVTTTNQAYLIDFGLATFTYGRFFELREDNTLENHYYHFEDYRHIGALDMFHIFYTSRQNAELAPESHIRTEIINYTTSMLKKLVYDRFVDTYKENNIGKTKYIQLEDLITIQGYSEEPIKDINWFYYLLDGLDTKAFHNGGYTLRSAAHQHNVQLLKEMTYRWFLTTYCNAEEYKINWDVIERTIQNVQHIIPKIEPFEPIHIDIIQQSGKKRQLSHRKRKAKERKLQTSHHRKKKIRNSHCKK